MGRSGGGGGGGRSFGGGGGGARSSGGGFSGGGRSGGHSGGRSSGPSFNGPSYHHHGSDGSLLPFLIGTSVGKRMAQDSSGGGGGGNNNGNRPSNAPKGTGGGCGSVLVIVAVIIFLMFTFALISDTDGCSSSSITTSTVAREALPASAVNETGYYTDADGDWISSENRLTSGMKSFYKETGVQPYVYILPNGSITSTDQINAIAESLYDELFTDEGHFLLVFCDNNLGNYYYSYVAGSLAKSVMDDEAIDILIDYLDYSYEYSSTDEEVFSDTFEKTGDRIMNVTTSPIVYVAVCGAVVVVVVVVALVLKRRREAKEREAARQQEILSTPLEKFGDSEVEELARKYEQSAASAHTPSGSSSNDEKPSS